VENVTGWSPAAIFSMVGLAAFICGVALFYLVMNRTRKHRGAPASGEVQDG